MRNLPTRIKYLIATLVLIVIGAGAFFVNEKVKLGAISPHELLKCSKENIIGSQDQKDGTLLYACKNNPLQERGTKDLLTKVKTANIGQLDAKIAEIQTTKLGAVTKQINELEAQKTLIQNLTIVKENKDLRTKEARVWETNNGLKIAEISTVPQYYKDENGSWWQVVYGTTTRSAFDEQMAFNFLGIKIAYAVTQGFITTSASKDTIMVYNTGASSSWATARDATEATSITNVHGGANTGMNNQETTTETAKYSLHRSAFNIDISTIDTFDTITAATFEFFVDAKVNEITTNDDNNIFGFTPANPADVVAGDYDQCGSTGLATAINHSALSAGATTTFTYVAAGITNIEADKGTRHSICWRHQLDYDNVTPTDNSRNNSDIFFYDTAAKAPRLIVTWTDGVAPAASTEVPASIPIIIDF